MNWTHYLMQGLQSMKWIWNLVHCKILYPNALMEVAKRTFKQFLFCQFRRWFNARVWVCNLSNCIYMLVFHVYWLCKFDISFKVIEIKAKNSLLWSFSMTCMCRGVVMYCYLLVSCLAFDLEHLLLFLFQQKSAVRA